MPVTSSTTSNVSANTGSVLLLASNVLRKMATFFNDSTSATYVKHGSGATLTSFTVKIASGGYYELPHPVYTGDVYGTWDTVNGSMRVTETT